MKCTVMRNITPLCQTGQKNQLEFVLHRPVKCPRLRWLLVIPECSALMAAAQLEPRRFWQNSPAQDGPDSFRASLIF